ncbi:MAG: Phosphoglycerate mutase [Gammaproteobacteria bacterium]|nr:Phosphoglycerate mutase [Gammaproteobacteria bacterium]
MKTRFVLVRHTQPAVEAGICYGRTDLELASTWPLEFEHCLAKIPTAACIISSPLLRCRELAQAVGRRDHIDVQLDERLLELDFGAWTGKAWCDIPRESIDRWAADPSDYAPGEGESLRMLWARVRELRLELSERASAPSPDLGASGDVVIVGHHGPLRALAAHVEGRCMDAFFDYRIPCGGVLCMEGGSTRPM